MSDRIALLVAGGAEVAAVVEAHGAWIAEEVLATELVFVRDGDGSGLRQRHGSCRPSISTESRPTWPSPG